MWRVSSVIIIFERKNFVLGGRHMSKNDAKNSPDEIWKEKEEVVKEDKDTYEYATFPQQIDPTFLTVDPNDTFTISDPFADTWAELKTAHIKQKKLRSTLDEIAKTDNGMDIAVTYYKNIRIIIPLSKMGIKLSNDKKFTDPIELRRIKQTNKMLGAEIEFIIKSIDYKNKIVVASREDALLDNIKKYYATLDNERCSKVHRQPNVKARIIQALKEKLKIEVLGIQTDIGVKAIEPLFTSDLRKKWQIGDEIPVRIHDIKYPKPFDNCENDAEWLNGITIKAEHRTFEPDISAINFPTLRVGTKISAEVTGKGGKTFYCVLKAGVNAIAHDVSQDVEPFEGDIVDFKINELDPETKMAIGLITGVKRRKYRL